MYFSRDHLCNLKKIQMLKSDTMVTKYIDIISTDM